MAIADHFSLCQCSGLKAKLFSSRKKRSWLKWKASVTLSERVGGRYTAKKIMADDSWVAFKHFHMNRVKFPVLPAFQEVGEPCGCDSKKKG